MRYSWSLPPRIVVIRNMRCDILLFNNDSFLAPLGMGEFKVHRVRFFNYVPSGIRCVAYNNQSNRLAVSRTDGTVEIYNLSANYFQEKVSHLGAWFGVFDVNFFLKFNSAKSMFFVFKEIKRIVTLPHSLRSCLEPHMRSLVWMMRLEFWSVWCWLERSDLGIVVLPVIWKLRFARSVGHNKKGNCQDHCFISVSAPLYLW